MVRKRHCDISKALANVFALQPEPEPIGVGGPRFTRSKPIVVTSLVILAPAVKTPAPAKEILYLKVEASESISV
jgi:hypothetical protein